MTIKDEIAKPEYEGMSDAEVAAALNAKTVSQPRVFTMREVRAVAQRMGEWPNIVLRAEERPPTDAVKAAINAISTPDDQRFTSGPTGGLQVLGAGLTILAQAGDLSDGAVATIQALSAEDVPWWQSMGASAPFNEYDIALLRGE